MRIWLLLLVLAAPFSYALAVDNTGQAGQHPVLYGDSIVYENDGNIYVYDLSKNESKLIGKGSNPSLFGFIAVFETKESADLNDDGDTDDVVIQFADIRNQEVTSTKDAGTHANVFSNAIVFSTKESDLGVDFSNDGDLDDYILRQYDVATGETINLKAVGDFPVINQRVIVFQTPEKELDVDVNADGDKADDVLRVYNRDKHQADNTHVVGDSAALWKSGDAVFVSDGKLSVLDTRSLEVEPLWQAGKAPTLYDNLVIFERDDGLYSLSLDGQKLAKINIAGMQPSLFENSVAFVSSEKDVGDLNNNGKSDELVIRYAREEDSDGDKTSDFRDNCPSNPEAQVDSDGDGIGDACDTEPQSKKPENKEQKASVPSQNTSQNTSAQPESKPIAWYWYALIIILLPFIAYFGYKYYKKRQKSFGF